MNETKATITAMKFREDGHNGVEFRLTIPQALIVDGDLPAETHKALDTCGFDHDACDLRIAKCFDNDAVKSVQVVLQQMRTEGVIA